MSDLDIIKEIGKELDVELKELENIAYGNVGFTLNDEGLVTGLGLYSSKVKPNVTLLKELPQLQTLYLINNKISDISFLKGLTQLQTLHLSNNQISDYSFLKGLPQLQALHLSDNQISDISFLKGLPQLQTLYLSNNQISDISFLKGLPQLQTLHLSNNQISDISFLKGLTQLQTIFLHANNINDISSLQNMPNLKTMTLDQNNISDISPLRGLVELNKLSLDRNPIEELPRWISDFEMEILWDENGFEDGHLTLFDNPLKTPPVEIVKQGMKAIRDYFKSLEGKKRALNEVKALLVGDGSAGKTSLLKQLLGEDFDPEEGQTHGVNIRDHKIKGVKGGIGVHF